MEQICNTEKNTSAKYMLSTWNISFHTRLHKKLLYHLLTEVVKP